MKESKPYRSSVVGVFINHNQMILVGERSDSPDAWQLPQGGIEEDETPTQAIKREMFEELGIDDFNIHTQLPNSIKYEFEPGGTAEIHKKFRGQEQVWFHLRLKEGHDPDLKKAQDKEFSQLEWRAPDRVLKEIIEWKKESYKQAFKKLNILNK
jgi:putative (di)nucleoside polyphosphate hydrolase